MIATTNSAWRRAATFARTARRSIAINGQEVGARVLRTPSPGDLASTCSVWDRTRKIERVDIELGPRGLSPEDEARLHVMFTMLAGAHD